MVNIIILNVYKSDFYYKHSKETALLRVSGDIRLAMNNRRGTVLTLFDLSKAFNSENHSLLLTNTKDIGFSYDILTWLGSYRADRPQPRYRIGLNRIGIMCGWAVSSQLVVCLWAQFSDHCFSHYT